MTDELALYQSNRARWLVSAAVNMARQITGYTDAQIHQGWPRMQQDYKRATWTHLDESSRERVRRVRKG